MKGVLLLGALLIASAALSVLIGQVHFGPLALWQGLIGGDGPAALTIRILRAPRAMVGIGAGAALGLSGAIFQLLLRNPLAAPDIMGFTSGSGLAILGAVSLGLALPMPLVAAGGGLIAALIVGLLARAPGQRGDVLSQANPLVLVMVGLGVGFTTSALGTFLMTRLSGPEAQEAVRWLSGSLSARSWAQAGQVWGLSALLCLALIPQIRALRLLELGPELATGLGLRLLSARRGLALTAVCLAAAGVAVAGPVPFVALMAAPLGQRLTRARDPATQLAAAALAGAAIMVLADLIARAAIPGLQLPIGVMTGIMGAPYLMWRLSREMKKGEL